MARGVSIYLEPSFSKSGYWKHKLTSLLMRFNSKQENLRQQGELMRLENHNNNNSSTHKFQWPIYSVKRRQGRSFMDFDSTSCIASINSGDKVRSILVQVGSMKIEDGEERTCGEVSLEQLNC
jgi:hypothetical protein